MASHDPFVSPPGPAHLRFSAPDKNLFALGPDASPDQARRALEAHLADTDRRMEEAGKLGTALVQQRKELAERLREVEQLHAQGELTADLRQRLAEIEQDYNDVARESARAFLPKQRIPSNEAGAAGSPFAQGRRSVSPSKFEATGSPTKFGVPNRKVRNQPGGRVHDIEFAAEISTSLISQVRNLQALLAEKETELRDTKTERSRLELEAEGFQQRLRALDESEHRYKDENWSLETQVHELQAAQREAAEREKKLAQGLAAAQAQRGATQRELDEARSSLAGLDERHAAAVKQHDIEVGTLRRREVMTEGEKVAMQRKIDDLTSQNQELARAFSAQRAGRTAAEREAGFATIEEELSEGRDTQTPDPSPPTSPVKVTPRHSMLESETLKSSLQHAQRTIQSLRTNVHREKTEKLELKRLLQEARDEVEKARSEAMPTAAPAPRAARGRKAEAADKKKPLARLGQLGGVRASRSEVYRSETVADDPDWEDQAETASQFSTVTGARSHVSGGDIAPIPESSSDQFETANEETSDAAFETANERGGVATETDDFHTGAEEFSDEDEVTETEESPTKRLGRGGMQRPSLMSLAHSSSRYSLHSTASTSDEEEEEDGNYLELRTPTALPPPRMRIRVSRGALSNRRSRMPSEEPMLPPSSPASATTVGANETPQQPQSLFAELGDLDGSDDEEATPSRSVRSRTGSMRSGTPGSVRGWTASPPPRVPALPRTIMVDSGVMTEAVHILAEPVVSPQSVVFAPGDRPLSTYSDAGAQHDPGMEAALAQFPSPPGGPTPSVPTPIFAPEGLSAGHVEPTRPTLTVAPTVSQEVEPVEVVASPLAVSRILSEDWAPVEATSPLAVSRILSEDSEPVVPVEAPPTPLPLSMASVRTEEVEPREQPAFSTVAALPDPSPVQLAFSRVAAEDIQPVTAPQPPLALSRVQAESITPVQEAPIEVAPPLAFSHIHAESITPVQTETPAALSLSSLRSQQVEPVHFSPADSEPAPRSPKRDAIMIPRDGLPQTPPSRFGIFGRTRVAKAESPIIAEDETRQSLHSTPAAETPESQRPLRERSGNTDERPPRRQAETADQSAQTSLTGGAIEDMEAARAREALHAAPEPGLGIALGENSRPKGVDTGDVHSRPKGVDTGDVYAKAVDFRPGSSASRASLHDAANAPPLPPNHRQVIEAARSGSGGATSMPPPLFPASMGPPPFPATRPLRPMSPASGRGTPRLGSAHGSATAGDAPHLHSAAHPHSSTHLHSSTRIPTRLSRRSSVSSFVSELDSRFNMHSDAGGGMMAHAPPDLANTDPRMIRAITETMIGEYLWKYTRRAGRADAMTEKRHRRYFWVHPYTRTLYWSDRDPSTGGLRAKSVPIDAVRVVTDDNPMPPGLHRKSLVIVSPSRTVKLTCTTGQRHETWFNALSYLLLRGTDDAATADAEDMAGHITREDVDEFNPGARPRPAAAAAASRFATATTPSLSSFASRTQSPALGRQSPALGRQSPALGTSMNRSNSQIPGEIPTLTPSTAARYQHRKKPSRPSLGNSTLGRLSGYWDAKMSGTLSSIRSRGSVAAPTASGTRSRLFDPADSAHDSAEDVRAMIERQDREADRLENVRACCDGKHDVGTLPRAKGRHTPDLHHIDRASSTTPTPFGTFRSRA